MFTDPLTEEEKAHEPLLGSSPAVLVWKDLAVISKKLGKVLLKPMNGKITGGFWAVMGPSGSGKTTLLNALACRLDQAVRRTGECRLNGRKYHNRELKAMSCYVMQEDVLNAYLTVYETLYFTAKLRLGRETSEEKIEKRIAEVLGNMEIDHTRNTIVGNSLLKGISGGEKKRLCIAMELLTHPKLLFLDEPTSGLDSVTALIVCQKLKELGNSGFCTVVSTIHQPQSKIFNLFDFLILLRDGNIVYQGTSGAGVLGFFEKAGFPCPPLTNPADFLMDVITPVFDGPNSQIKTELRFPGAIMFGGSEEKVPKDTNDNNKEESERKKMATISEKGSINIEMTDKKSYYIPPTPEFMNKVMVNLDIGLEKDFLTSKEHIPWCSQLYVLLIRNFKEYKRKWRMVLTQILCGIFMSVIIGTVFLQIGNDQLSVSKRSPSLFFTCINQGVFVSMMTINSFPSERALSLRERKAGTYNVSAYFVAKMIADFLVQLINPILFSIIVYLLIGYQSDVNKFFVFMGFMILCNNASMSLTLMISTLCKTADLSVTVLPIALELSRIFGGFFLSPKLLPGYFSWIDALSYVKYAYIGISLNELEGLELICLPGQLKNGQCPITTGDYTIELLGLNYITIEAAALILLSFIIFTRAVAFLGIRYLK